jgi:hypothetical protein
MKKSTFDQSPFVQVSRGLILQPDTLPILGVHSLQDHTQLANLTLNVLEVLAIHLGFCGQ